MENTHSLLSQFTFDKTPAGLGDDGRFHLSLTAASPAELISELGTEGSITLYFVDDDENSSYEQDYHYTVDKRTKKLVFHPDPDPDPETGVSLPLFQSIQSDRNTVSLASKNAELTWLVSNWKQPGRFQVYGSVVAKGGGEKAEFRAQPFAVADALRPGPPPSGQVPGRPSAQVSIPIPLPVTLHQAQREQSFDQLLWGLIRRRTINFSRYRGFIDRVLCNLDDRDRDARDYIKSRQLPFSRSASYTMLRFATEFYLMQEAGVAIDDDTVIFDPVYDADERQRTGGIPFSIKELRDHYLEMLENEEGKVLPYFKIIREKLSEVDLKTSQDLILGEDVCYGILKSRLQAPPLMELIWSYWHEEGGLVQTMNALSLRFQNVRRPGPDPLANLAIDPLRPMNNILWGYIEDERNRLTMNRRNLEYQYEYGFGLIGRGVQPIAVAENRTFFLRGFHSLLRACTEFYQQANFTTVIPDGFPILNHLREVHLTLAEGAHNQYGDLPWTARAEMLTQQWILARPEVREFLGGRIMVPYTEPWMDRVDNMKSLQGWTPTNITHFRDLGVFGEQLLLSIRYGSWNGPTVGATSAANWAHYWREEIQRYIHAYKAVTGIDLATDLGDIRQNMPENEERYLQPGQLIERQNALQQGQLRRTRQLNAALAPPRPIISPAPPRRIINGG